MAPISTSDLRRHLESLLQEPYDEIYNLTFAAESKTHTVTESWKPPHLLQVDRASRLTFAASFFQDATFVFRSASFPCEARNIASSWLKSQSPKNLERVKEIRPVFKRRPHKGHSHDSADRAEIERQMLKLILALMQTAKDGQGIHFDHPAHRLAKNACAMVVG